MSDAGHTTHHLLGLQPAHATASAKCLVGFVGEKSNYSEYMFIYPTTGKLHKLLSANSCSTELKYFFVVVVLVSVSVFFFFIIKTDSKV